MAMVASMYGEVVLSGRETKLGNLGTLCKEGSPMDQDFFPNKSNSNFM